MVIKKSEKDYLELYNFFNNKYELRLSNAEIDKICSVTDAYDSLTDKVFKKEPDRRLEDFSKGSQFNLDNLLKPKERKIASDLSNSELIDELKKLVGNDTYGLNLIKGIESKM